MPSPSHEIQRTTHTSQVHLFGSLRVTHNGAAIAITRSRERALFTYLVLHPRTAHSREKLAEMLWPDRASERLARNFNNVLYRLQTALGAGWLEVNSKAIALKQREDLFVDAWAFEQLSAANDPNSLENAINLYAADANTGDAMLLPEAYEDDWLLPLREQFHEQFLNALLTLAASHEQFAQHEAALKTYRRLIQMDALREEATTGAMRALAHLNRVPEALSAYEQLEAAMQTELRAKPSAAAQALVGLLRARLQVGRLGMDEATNESTAHIPFVGRASERAQLLAKLEQAHNQAGGLVVLMGEAGSGKSRLLDEVVRSASRRGWQIASARGNEFTRPAPFAPLAEALANALPRPRLQQLAGVMQPMWLHLVQSILPKDEAPTKAETSALDVFASDADSISTAVRRVCVGLQSIAPHLFILDDVQWADAGFWDVLESLRGPLAELSVLLVISGRLNELQQQPDVWQRLNAWETAGVPTLALSGLRAEELRELAAGVGYGMLNTVQAAQLVSATGGNPLMALALLREAKSKHSQNPTLALQSLAELTREVGKTRSSLDGYFELLQRRLSALSSAAQHAIKLAAVLGYRFEYEALSALAQVDHLPSEQLPAALNELERGRMIHLEPDGYRFDHDTLRAFIYSRLPESTHRELHRAAIRALVQHTPLNSELNAAPLLYHAEQAHDTDAIATYAQLAGEQALGIHSFVAALRYFEQAISALDDGRRATDDELRTQSSVVSASEPPRPSSNLLKRLCAASLGRTRALNHLAQREAQHAELSRLREWVVVADDEAIATDSAIEHAVYYTATTQWAEAGRWVDEAMAHAERLHDNRLKFRAADAAYHALHRQFKNAEATELAHRMLALAEELNDAAAKADALANLCEIRSLMGQFDEASGYGQRAVQLFQQQNNLIGEARGATALGDLYLRTSDFGRARANLQRAMTLYTELNFKSKYAHCANALGAAEYWLGNFPAALDLYESGLKSAREANDRWYIAYTLTNIGELYYDIGEMALAEQNQREAVGVAQEINFKWVEGYARCYLGRICAHNKQFTLSIDEARTAVQCMEDSNNADNWYFCQSRLALCYLDSGDLAAASNEVDVMLARLQMVMPRKVHLQAAQNAAYAVRKAQGRLPEARQHICLAEAALLGQASELPPDAREKFLKFARLNQETLKAIKAESVVVQQKLLRLDGAGYATVNWTLHHPSDDALADDARRRAMRQRLADEAAAQGARATDEDLGDAVA